MKRCLLLCVAGVWGLCQSVTAAPSPDVTAMLDGVQTIAAPGVPGTVAVFGPQAFVICEGAVKSENAPLIAAAHYGEGRIVIFGHNGYFSADHISLADTTRLLSNVFHWAGGKAGKDPRIGLAGHDALADMLIKQGFHGTTLPKKTWNTGLANIDVLILDTGYIHEADVAALTAFVKRGGGLVMGATGWGWESLNRGKSLGVDFLANRVLEPAGLAWTGGSIKVDASHTITPSHDPDPLLHAEAALQRLLQPEPKDAELLRAKKLPKGTKSPLGQAGSTLLELAMSAGPNNPIVTKLHDLDRDPKYAKVPTEKQPLKSGDGIARVLLVMHLLRWDAAAGEKITASPAAAEFPGRVPTDALRISKAVDVDTNVPRWHSTGFYAAPGETITVEIPESAVKKGLKVQIGCHTDDLFELDHWSRVPRIVTSTPLDAAKTQLTSRFGGPVYIVVPDKANGAHIWVKSASAAPLGVLSAKIIGAIEMPLFVLGKTTLAEWKQSIRSRPAPWAELASDKIILTFKSEAVRTLDDPEAVLRHWDAVQDANADLAQYPAARACPMRIVSDMQISAGYMHSGYPIMTWLDVTNTFTDVAKLKTGGGGWGFYHELGHNHQTPDWTFDGTGEVTVNLFSMHTLETVCGLSPNESTSRALVGPAAKIKKYLANPDFEEWKKDAFLALAMYAQLRLEFGWEPYQKVFAEYRDLPANERPKGEMEKHDQWMVRFSRTVGKNLGPFFTVWGIPTSQAARDSIKALPTWMPADVK